MLSAPHALTWVLSSTDFLKAVPPVLVTLGARGGFRYAWGQAHDGAAGIALSAATLDHTSVICCTTCPLRGGDVGGERPDERDTNQEDSMRDGANGTPMQTYRTPKAAARKARVRRRQDKAWAAKASTVEVAYACVCERNPENCHAELHGTTRP